MKWPGKRREAREAALQFLFSHDLNDGLSLEDLDEFWALRPMKPKLRDFAIELLKGVFAERETIDSKIAASLENYEMHRLSIVDRCILQLAVYQMVYREDIPNPVAINEAIEIAKRFGTNDSAKFINGILDAIHKNKKTSIPEPQPEPQEPINSAPELEN